MSVSTLVTPHNFNVFRILHLSQNTLQINSEDFNNCRKLQLINKTSVILKYIGDLRILQKTLRDFSYFSSFRNLFFGIKL